MAYSNFKATIWSKHIELELAKLMVFRDIVNTNHQGEVGVGKTVQIVGVNNPSIKTYIPGSPIGSAETPADNSQKLVIDQYKYFNVTVDDVDKAQTDTDIMKALLEGGANGLASEADKYIATCVKNAKSSNIVASTAITTPTQMKEIIDNAFEKLWNEGVNTSTGNTYIVLSPKFYRLFKNSLTETLTNNEEMIKKGILGMYNGAYVKMSNNIYNDGTDDYCAVLTKDAIAFADGIEKTEAYRPENSFADAVKSLYTYGAVTARPEQIVCLKLH